MTTCGFLSDEVSLRRRDAARARRRAGVAGRDHRGDAERGRRGQLALDQRARRGVRRDLRLAGAVGDRDDVRQLGAPFVVACSGWASSSRKPSASPSSSLSLDRVHPEVEVRQLRRHHRGDHRVERALEDRLDADPALWIFSDVPCVPKQERNVLTSDGGRRRLADDRQPRALALEARRLQRRDPVGGEDLVREQAAARRRRATGSCPACSPGPACRCASACRRRGSAPTRSTTRW